MPSRETVLHRRPALRGVSSRPSAPGRSFRTKHAVSRLAAELHDRVAQSLWSVDAEIASVMDLVPPTDDDTLNRLAAARDLVGKAYKDVRLTIGALRSDLPFQSDVVEALAHSLDAFSRRIGIATTFRTASAAFTWSRFVELQVLAIIQQGLDNVAQHALASNVALSIDSVPDGWVVTLRDDGRGFPDSPSSDLSLAGHYGMSIMRERAESFGGSLIFQSVENAGTSLILTVPISAAPRR